MKTRNPIAGNAHKMNIATAFIPKKGKGSYKRNKAEIKRFMVILDKNHDFEKPSRLDNMVANMLGRFMDKLKYAKRAGFF